MHLCRLSSCSGCRRQWSTPMFITCLFSPWGPLSNGRTESSLRFLICVNWVAGNTSLCAYDDLTDRPARGRPYESTVREIRCNSVTPFVSGCVLVVMGWVGTRMGWSPRGASMVFLAPFLQRLRHVPSPRPSPIAFVVVTAIVVMGNTNENTKNTTSTITTTTVHLHSANNGMLILQVFAIFS